MGIQRVIQQEDLTTKNENGKKPVKPNSSQTSNQENKTRTTASHNQRESQKTLNNVEKNRRRIKDIKNTRDRSYETTQPNAEQTDQNKLDPTVRSEMEEVPLDPTVRTEMEEVPLDPTVRTEMEEVPLDPTVRSEMDQNTSKTSEILENTEMEKVNESQTQGDPPNPIDNNAMVPVASTYIDNPVRGQTQSQQLPNSQELFERVISTQNKFMEKLLDTQQKFLDLQHQQIITQQNFIMKQQDNYQEKVFEHMREHSHPHNHMEQTGSKSMTTSESPEEKRTLMQKAMKIIGEMLLSCADIFLKRAAKKAGGAVVKKAFD